MENITTDDLVGRTLVLYDASNVPELDPDMEGYTVRVTHIEDTEVEVIYTSDDTFYMISMNSIYNLCLQNDIHLLMI